MTVLNKKEVSSFLEWMDSNGALFRRFSVLCNALESFLFTKILTSEDKTRSVVGKFSDVLKRCDTVNYDDEGIVEAYSILHFLDRYHRFQLTFHFLLEKGILPLKQLPIDTLDVGTGPAPVLFALSDIYSLLKKYGDEKNIDVLKNVKFNPDYAERSIKFRKWLHHFTEYANCFAEQNGIDPWFVPYHHGSFRDFERIDFRKIKNIYLKELIEEIEDDFYRADEAPPSRQFILNYLLPLDWKYKFRYDLITFGNFLTLENQVKNLSKELRSVGFALRNKGMILVVGGRERDYPEIYKLISKILTERKYYKKKSISVMRELLKEEFSYKYTLDDQFGNKLLGFYGKVLDRIKEHNCEKYMDGSILKDFNKMLNKNEISHKWAVRIFIKKSFPRRVNTNH